MLRMWSGHVCVSTHCGPQWSIFSIKIHVKMVAVVERTQESSTRRHFYSFFTPPLLPLSAFSVNMKNRWENLQRRIFVCFQWRLNAWTLLKLRRCTYACVGMYYISSSVIFRPPSLISSRPLLFLHQIHTGH